jgi:hypothetical protein
LEQSDKKSLRSQKTVEIEVFQNFLLVDGRSQIRIGTDPDLKGPKTYGPTQIRIWLRIRNTGKIPFVIHFVRKVMSSHNGPSPNKGTITTSLSSHFIFLLSQALCVEITRFVYLAIGEEGVEPNFNDSQIFLFWGSVQDF